MKNDRVGYAHATDDTHMRVLRYMPYIALSQYDVFLWGANDYRGIGRIILLAYMQIRSRFFISYHIAQ